ncbi:MAG TPA: hypothetical protein VFM88_13350 [Vicinamibacteria bacterium]|nr:hypothetical protein [Vicinamibacteria bacterium]
MKILRDEPQQLLVVEAPALGIPPAVGIVLKVVVFGIALAPLFFFSGSFFAPEPEPLPVMAFVAVATLAWLFVLLYFYRYARRAWRLPRRIRVDRYARELEIEEEGLLDGKRSEVLPLDRVQRVRVATTLARGALSEGRTRRPGIRLALDLIDARARPARRELDFVVEHLDKREEVADFAYRFARAAGLPYSRVLRSDPRELEIELVREAGQETETVPLLDGPANYAKDRVAPQATRAATQEKIAPFAPADFRGLARVAVWQPRQEVRFHKPLGFAAVGCLPFVAALAAGPVAFVLVRPEGPGLAPRVVASLIVGTFGLVIGLVALGGVLSALPRSVTLDWTAHTLTVGGLMRRSARPLSDIDELELKCVRTYHRGGKNSASYNSYRCDVIGHMRGGSQEQETSEVLVASAEFREDPDSPYRMTLPLATELADALGVKRRVTDYA